MAGEVSKATSLLAPRLGVPAGLCQPCGVLQNAYQARLPSRDAVLTALRSAHAARLAIEQGRAPVDHKVLQLAAFSACAASFEHLQDLRCLGAAFNSDGRFLAVYFKARGYSVTHTDHRLGYWVRHPIARTSHEHHTWLQGIAVLRTTEGFPEQACFHRPSGPGTAPDFFRWAPKAPYLSLALEYDEPEADASQAAAPVVLVCDAESGAVLHDLKAETERAFRAACLRKGQHGGLQLKWDWSGQWLIVITQDDGSEMQGMLTVFDVVHNAVVGQSVYTASLAQWQHYMDPAVWLPSSQLGSWSHGLLFSCGVQLQSPQAFAGKLALAFLQEPCYLLTACFGSPFSPDGQKLLARMCDVEDSTQDPAKASDHCFLRCQAEELGLTFTPMHSIFRGHGWSWLPCSSGVVLGQRFENQDPQCSQIVRLGGQPTTVIPGQALSVPLVFSPSHGIAAANGPQGSYHILSLESGSQLWAADALSFDTSRCVAFLPSGRGILCVEASAAGLSRKRKVDKLHILHFA